MECNYIHFNFLSGFLFDGPPSNPVALTKPPRPTDAHAKYEIIRMLLWSRDNSAKTVLAVNRHCTHQRHAVCKIYIWLHVCVCVRVCLYARMYWKYPFCFWHFSLAVVFIYMLLARSRCVLFTGQQYGVHSQCSSSVNWVSSLYYCTTIVIYWAHY